MAQRLREWFDSIDRDRNGLIDALELQQALANGNLHFSLNSVTQMIRLFSRERNHYLLYSEFEKLHAVLEQIQADFFAADIRGVGRLSVSDVAKTLRKTGYKLDYEVFTGILKVFDPEDSKELDLTAFIRMTMLLRGARAVFGAYDPSQSGSVTLDFNQFLYASTNLI